MQEIIEQNDLILKRMHDKLVTLEPGTPEFRELVKDIQDLTKIQVDLKRYRPEFWLKVLGIAAPILGTMTLYGASIYVDNSEYIKPKVAGNVEKWMTPWKR